jgi:hypothetical protein
MVDYSYLSSRQAVRDIISFVQSMEVQQLLNRVERGSGDKYAFWDQSASTSKMTATKRRTSAETTPIFITFGGSYPGMLAAWSRLLHPETIFAAVSNSAPIRAQLEFPEYKERVGFDLGSEDIGGSAECRFIVEEGHAQVAAILERYSNDTKSDDLDRVATMFNVCGGSDMLRASRRNQEVSTIYCA